MGLISGILRYSYITRSSAELAALHAGVLGSLGTPRASMTMLLPSSGTSFQSANFQGIAQDGRENCTLLLFPMYTESAWTTL